jgi:hypothetical protein
MTGRLGAALARRRSDPRNQTERLGAYCHAQGVTGTQEKWEQMRKLKCKALQAAAVLSGERSIGLTASYVDVIGFPAVHNSRTLIRWQ